MISGAFILGKDPTLIEPLFKKIYKKIDYLGTLMCFPNLKEINCFKKTSDFISFYKKNLLIFCVQTSKFLGLLPTLFK